MYNFFSNKLKYKAFVKALKQVEAEGFYANLEIDETSMPILPDLSKAVASLSSKTNKTEKPAAETVNIAELESDLEGQKATEGRAQQRLERRFASDRFKDKPQTNSEFYKNLFKPSDSFLSGENITDAEFLSGRPFEYSVIPKTQEGSEDNSEFSSKLQAVSDLVQISRARREERARKRLELEQSEEDDVEIPDIEADIEMPEMEQEKQEEQEAPKLMVEVVADIPEPEPPKTITKTVYVTKEVPVPVEVPKKPKAKKATTSTKKKKRKYDADISGGFNY